MRRERVSVGGGELCDAERRCEEDIVNGELLIHNRANATAGRSNEGCQRAEVYVTTKYKE